MPNSLSVIMLKVHAWRGVWGSLIQFFNADA